MFLLDLDELAFGELKAEGAREAAEVAGDGLVEGGGGGAVEGGEIRVENHLFATNDVDKIADIDIVDGDDGVVGAGSGVAGIGSSATGFPMHNYIITYLASNDKW